MTYSFNVFGLSQFSRWIDLQEQSKVLQPEECKSLRRTVIEAKKDKAPLAFLRKAIQELSEKVKECAFQAFLDHCRPKKVSCLSDSNGELKTVLIGGLKAYQYLAFPDKIPDGFAFHQFLKEKIPDAPFSLRKAAIDKNEEQLNGLINELRNKSAISEQLATEIQEKFQEFLARSTELLPEETVKTPLVTLQPKISGAEKTQSSLLVNLPTDLLGLITKRLPLDDFANLMLGCKAICHRQGKLIVSDADKMTQFMSQLQMTQMTEEELVHAIDQFTKQLGDETPSAPVCLLMGWDRKSNRQLLAKFPDARELKLLGVCPSVLPLEATVKPFAFEKLSFLGTVHTPEARAALKELINRCPQLSGVEFLLCSALDDETLSVICSKPDLRELTIKNGENNVTSDAVVLGCTNLRKLSLDRLQVNLHTLFTHLRQLEWLEPFCDTLSTAEILQLDPPPTLKEFTIGINADLSALQYILSKCSRLENLRIRGMQIPIEELRRLNLPPLTELEMSDSGIDREGLEVVFSKCPTLEILKLNGQFRLSAADIAQMQFPKTMKEIRAEGMTLDRPAVANIYFHCPKISSINCKGLSGRPASLCSIM